MVLDIKNDDVARQRLKNQFLCVPCDDLIFYFFRVKISEMFPLAYLFLLFASVLHVSVLGKSIPRPSQTLQNHTSNHGIVWFFSQHIQDFDQDLVQPCQMQPDRNETCWCYRPPVDALEFFDGFNDIQSDRVQPKQLCEFGKSRLRKWFMRKSYTWKFRDSLGRDWVYCKFFIRVWGGKSFYNVELTPSWDDDRYMRHHTTAIK
jgi:hypothetical protein